MTPEQIEAAAESDPDNRPLSPEDLARMKRTPRIKIIQRALKIGQEDIADRTKAPRR
jgi:putative transcriptional regulator